MNVQINATLVVQIINFVIAYVVLRFIFLKPAVALVEAEEQKRADLRTIISYNYVLVMREKDALYNQWREGHLFYQKQAPPVQDLDLVLFKDIYPVQDGFHISPEVTSLLIQSAAQELIKKVKIV